MENDLENVDSTNNTETTENNEELELDLSDDNSDVEALMKEIATLKAQKEHFKKKAEAKTEEKSEVKAPNLVAPSQELSSKDALLLAKAEVDLDDVDEVVDFAKYRKIPIAEAIKNPTLKAILKDRVEERTTALATQMNSSRKSSPTSVDALLDLAKIG